MTDDSAAPEPTSDLTATPYVGLVPYREEDADFFFGRDDETRIVGGNLRAFGLTLLYGASGVGKTSLLRAGVIPELRRGMRENATAESERALFGVCVFSAWRDEPLPALMDAIRIAAAEAVGNDGLRPWGPGESVAEALRSWTERVRTLLVILDQFEDYFLYHPEEEGAGTFAGELPAVVNDPNLRVHFLLSIREDALAKLDRFKGSIPRLFANYVRVPHLSRAAAREAIEGPLREWNSRRSPHAEYTVEPELVDAVLDATAGGLALVQGDVRAEGSALDRERVETPLLQLLMERLWRATVEVGSHELTVSRLERLGGAQRIVENHLLDALGTLTSSERAVAADLFRFLVTRSKTKIAHPASDLGEWTGHSEQEAGAVLDKLCRAESGRILRPVPPSPTSEGATRYELFHDVLAEPILEWRRDYEQDRARKAAVRRFARVGGGLLALTGIFAALGIWALVQRSEARSATRSAASLALASAAREELSTRLDASLLLGVAAYRESPNAEAASAVVGALEAARRSGAEAILRGDRGGVRAIAFSPDSRTLASADFAGTLRLWDVREKVSLGEPLRGHTNEVWGLAFSRDGATLASASHDGTVRLWDVQSRTALGRLPIPHASLIATVAFSPDGRTLAVGGDGGLLQLWDASRRRPLGRPLVGHRDRVVSVAFAPDGRTLASAGYDGTIRLWNVRSRKLTGVIEDAHDGNVLSIAFGPDGRTFASSGSDDVLRVWNTRSRRLLGGPFGAGTGHIWSVAFSPDGRTLASSGEDGTVRLWDARSHAPVGEPLRGHQDRVVSVAFSPDGRMLASSAYDGTVRLWAMPRTAVLGQPIGRHGDPVKSVAFSPDGSRLASGGSDPTVGLWDPPTRRSIAPLEGERAASLESIAWSPDGSTLAAAAVDGSITLWDASAAEARAVLRGHDGAVQSISFAPDGRMLASGGFDGTVRLWDLDEGGEPLGEPFRSHEGQVWSVAFSPDGRTLASAGSDAMLRLWDVGGHTLLREIQLEDVDVALTVAFSPDGRTLASGSVGGLVQLWDGELHAPLGEPLRGHERQVWSVAFSPDGRRLASASDDGSVRLWDVEGLRALGGPLRPGSGPVLGVTFSPDGRAVASGGSDGTVRLWDGILWRNLVDLEAHVCTLVVGNLSESEWQELVPGLEYRTPCPT